MFLPICGLATSQHKRNNSMPKRTDIKSIMIIGAGPIVIGQACEFDYSGAQACKALRAEGYRVILVNSNPATIMTDPGLADATYIEPITPEIVEKIIAREKPDALLPTMGGQTALNTAMKLGRVRRAGTPRRRTDRREGRGHRPRRGPAEIPRRDGGNRHRIAALRHRAHDRGSPRGTRHHRPARRHPAHPSRSAAPAAASPTTARNSSRSSAAASKPRRRPKC